MREQLMALKIGVLMGGLSREREVSLRSGARVLESLQRQGFRATGIDVDHRVADRLRDDQITFAFIALHGRYGEDGCIQGLLELLGIPYTGSGVLASSIGMNKVATKRILAQLGVPIAGFTLIDIERGVDSEALRVVAELGLPLVIKPVSEGSSIGVHIVDTLAELDAAVRNDLYYFGRVLAEQYIPGVEVTVGILGTNGSSRALPVLELRPHKRFYDYEAKYTPGMTDFILPAELSDARTREVQATAIAAHCALGCRGFSRVDAIVPERGPAVILEVNTIPGMTDTSDLPAQAKVAGIDFDELVFEILKGAYVENHPQRTNALEDGAEVRASSPTRSHAVGGSSGPAHEHDHG